MPSIVRVVRKAGALASLPVLLALAASLATVVGCAISDVRDAPAGRETPAIREAATIRVGTYNIRLQPGDTGTPNAWDERKADMVELIRKLDLDAFGLQEVCPGQADYLTNSLPQYTMVGVHREDGVRKGEASPVFYRKDRFDAVKNDTFWLSETPDVPGSKSWGTACTRVCSWALLRDRTTGKAFCFANTHTDHVSALARKEGMLLIIRRMREFAPAGTPIVFTGDHNCRETDEPAKAVSKLLKNALYVSETPPEGPWRTFTGWRWRDREYPAVKALELAPDARNARKGSPHADEARRCGSRIDYIYVSDGIRVLSYATHGDARPGTELYPSDHFPVSAVIELPHEQNAVFSVSADRADCLYACGEKATFTISTPQTVGTAVVTLDDFSTNVVAREIFDLSKTNEFTISGTLGEPGFMRLRVGVSGGTKQKIYGVGFEPEKIRKTSPSPEDFDAFWSEAKRKLDETTPVDARLERVDERCNDKWDYYRISVASYKGRVWGYLSVPKGASAERKYPVRVEVPGAGKGKWAHDMSPVAGVVCLKMTAHSFPLAFDDKEFLRQYAELEREVKEKYGVSNYAVAGLGKSREEFYYYRAFLGISRAVDWVVAQPWADKSSVTYSGGSQGGGFGLALLALNKNFTKGLLKVPALSDNMAPLVGRRSGCGPCHIFGQPEADRETAIKWAPYFDGANFASRITCPVRVLVGFADDTCPPSAVYATYNEIRAKDHAIVHGIGMGHGCDKHLVAQLEKWLHAQERR